MSEAISVAVTLLAVAFGYGRLNERVKSLEDKVISCEEASSEKISQLERDTKRALELAHSDADSKHARLREELRKDTDTLEMKFRMLATQMESLRHEVLALRERIHQDMMAQTQLLHQIKGRLEKELPR